MIDGYLSNGTLHDLMATFSFFFCMNIAMVSIVWIKKQTTLYGIFLQPNFFFLIFCIGLFGLAFDVLFGEKELEQTVYSCCQLDPIVTWLIVLALHLRPSGFETNMAVGLDRWIGWHWFFFYSVRKRSLKRPHLLCMRWPFFFSTSWNEGWTL